MPQLNKALEPFGLRTDNVADMYTMYWMNAWEAAHGVSNPTTKAQAQAVRAQVVAAMLKTPDIVKANDAAKQEFAEALLVQALIVDGLDQAAQKDKSLKAQVEAAARQGARGMGLDLDQMRLTEKGFVPAK